MTVCVDPVPPWTADPPSVAEKTPLPVAVGAVTVAVYVPFPLSVTDPTVPVPEERLITTVEPPALRLLPYWSFACTVSVTVDPFAVTELLDAVSVDWLAVAAPTWVVRADEVPVSEVLSVAVIVRDTPDVVGTV